MAVGNRVGVFISLGGVNDHGGCDEEKPHDLYDSGLGGENVGSCFAVGLIGFIESLDGFPVDGLTYFAICVPRLSQRRLGSYSCVMGGKSMVVLVGYGYANALCTHPGLVGVMGMAGFAREDGKLKKIRTSLDWNLI